MPSQVFGELVDVPHPVAILLESAFIVLLALSLLASICSAGCLLWRWLGDGHPLSPLFSSAHASSGKQRHMDEESCAERADLGFEDDTEEEYMRRPY